MLFSIAYLQNHLSSKPKSRKPSQQSAGKEFTKPALSRLPLQNKLWACWTGLVTASTHKESAQGLLVACPASWCTGNCRWTQGSCMGMTELNFTGRVKTLLAKCVIYVQNASCTTHGEFSTLPSRAGPSTAENLHPGEGRTKWHCWLSPGQQKAPSPSHCNQTRNCLG